MTSLEHADVIIVGARPAGSAAATALAREGRKVIALDSARFPSSTISTHLLWPAGVAELKRLGALERVLAAGPPRLPIGYTAVPGIAASGRYSPIDGIDYGLCVRRIELDAALVATAREAGAEVREGTKVSELVWENGRVAGVRANDRDGGLHELRAPLVIGADGRRSTVARLAGAEEPFLSNPNGRACYYAYFDDPHPGWRDTAAQWLQGAELGTAFPCDGDLTLVLLMPPLSRVPDFKANKESEYDRTIAELLPDLAERLKGCERQTNVVAATDLPSYFRRSTGPGWALVGDAGHFKDPVTAQGIRDALRFGRLLGLAAAPTLDEPGTLARSLEAWERQRDVECLPFYHHTNQLARGRELNPLDIELHRYYADHPDGSRELLDLYSRQVRPEQVLTPGRLALLLSRALRRRGTHRVALLRHCVREGRLVSAQRRQAKRAFTGRRSG